MEYLVIFEEAEKIVGAYAPDLPGCVAVGETRDEAKHLIREAIELHIESLREHGEGVRQEDSTAILDACCAGPSVFVLQEASERS